MYKELIKHRAIVHYKYFLRSIRKVAACYGVGKSTLCRWLQKDGIETKRKQRTSILERINPVIENLLKEIYLRTKQLSKEVYNLLNVKASTSTCSRSVRFNKFSYKRTRLQVTKENTLQCTKSFKASYLQATNIVSIDETFFYYNEYPKYGYSKRGKQLKHRIREHPRRKKLTLYAAIGQERILGFKLSSTNGNSNDFLEFLKSLNLKDNTVLMDNVAFHKTKEVRAYLEDTGSQALFVPPYSPDYNPIELVFSKLKAIYRRIDSDMTAAVSKALEAIKSEDASPYFKHVENLIRSIE